MAQKVIIPRLGQTMTEGVVAKWYKKENDQVQVGDDIYELEYDKSTATIQAKKAGIIHLLCEEGDTVPLGEAVAMILEEGEQLDGLNSKNPQVSNVINRAETVTPPTASDLPEPLTATEAKSVVPMATPAIKRLAKEMGIDLEQVAAAKPNTRISREDLEAFARAVPQQAAVVHDCTACSKCNDEKVSPLARKLAKELNIDLSQIVPADGRRINKEDIQAAVAARQEAVAPAARRQKLSIMRKVISQRMTKSYFTYPTVTLTTDAEMSDLLKFRDQLNEKFAIKDIKLSVTDILVAVVARALRDNPIINTSLEEEEIVYHEQVNVGIAVALDNGLVVPVIKNADQLKLEQIAQESKRLVGLAKGNLLRDSDLSGGTFTITNLGSFGIDSFNPIINSPESAILGIGRTVEIPAVVQGKIAIAKKAVLSLTHDHRVIDGVPAAKFLQSIVNYIEKPYFLLMD